MVINQRSIRTIFKHSVLAASLCASLPSVAAEKICAIYPHLKDSYWLSVNYGMVSEAEKQGVNLRVLEAGGYPNKSRQEQQLALCTQWGADAIILGTVDPHAYEHNLKVGSVTRPYLQRSTNSILMKNRAHCSKAKSVSIGIGWVTKPVST